MEVTKLRLVFLFSFSTLISRLWANVAEFDDFWKQHEMEARKLVLKAYQPSPENITNQLNYNVNKTRRYLRGKHKKYSGPCLATNPIDRYNYDNDVINPKPGTLRHVVIKKKLLWIFFAHDMKIKLPQKLIVQSEKTIDGRRENVHIAYGCSITLQFVHNVIIHNIHVHHVVESLGGLIRDSEDHSSFRTVGDGDGISIFGSSNIWLDCISFTHPTISIKGNRFIAPNDPFAKDITHRIYVPESKWNNWVWRSEGDLFMNGAFFRTSGPSSSSQFTFNKKNMIEAKPGTFVGRLTHFAGALNWKKSMDC
uniref:Pectate lyase n=1 Tax=Gossypium raimondii TaxID=29730 RepID=A0A0D2RP72_GOSRA|nr:hypothetical protein B456_006G037300 [Gossypium raimondii]